MEEKPHVISPQVTARIVTNLLIHSLGRRGEGRGRMLAIVLRVARRLPGGGGQC